MPAADRALLERILSEAAVDTRVEPPSWAEWLRDALMRVLERTAGAFGRSLPSLPPGVAAVIGWTIVALLVAAIALIVMRSLTARAVSRPRAAPKLTPAVPPSATAPVNWRAEAARRLAAGQVEQALAAGWWWFATAISRGPVDAAWTTREVLLRARRGDLEPLGRELDIWMYGVRRPAAKDVAALLRAIEAKAA